MLRVSASRHVCAALLRRQPLQARRHTRGSGGSVRSLSAPLCTESATPTGSEPLQQWALVVDPFSIVRARLGCSISVRSLDPHAFPEANRAFITLRGTSAGESVKLHRFHVSYDNRSRELVISAERVSNAVSAELTAPIKSELHITTTGKASVQVKQMECDVCKVQTEQGDCVLHSVKGHQVNVQSYGGNITGVGTIHGNVDISTSGHGAVEVKKLQGTIMNVSTEHGPLKVKAIYAESTTVSSNSGRVELGNVQGNTTVDSVSGDVIIDGSNGHLKVSSQRGDVDAYVGDSGSAELHSQEGAVCVRIPSSIRAGVELCGASVDVSPEVALHGKECNTAQGQTTVTGQINGKTQTDQRIKAQSQNGSIRLKTQSWFESLKLGS
ncbi:protein FAM185A [Lampris incognitus]|uniref:protein FAM185A n=1 Tax=Lampris incognitus TaxID=2546036 RepID=UPI0024B6133C|nr:protein FAM185A [Lampris incognitus]